MISIGDFVIHVNLGSVERRAPHFIDSLGRSYFWDDTEPDNYVLNRAGWHDSDLETIASGNSLKERTPLYADYWKPTEMVEIDEGVVLCMSKYLLQIDTNRGILEEFPAPSKYWFQPNWEWNCMDMEKEKEKEKTNTHMSKHWSRLDAQPMPGGGKLLFVMNSSGASGILDFDAKTVTTLSQYKGRHLKLSDPASLLPSGPLYTPSSHGNRQEKETSTASNSNGRIWTWLRSYYSTPDDGPRCSTLLVDLVTGKRVELSKTLLHPLFTISPHLTLAIATGTRGDRPQVFVVVLDWTLPVPFDFNDDPDVPLDPRRPFSMSLDLRPKYIAKLPAKFQALHRFVFDKHSNTLLVYPIGQHPKECVQFPNFFSILRSSTGKTVYPWYPTNTSRSELTSLLEIDCPLPYDLQLDHLASKQTWNVHRDVIRRHDGLLETDAIDRLARVVKYSCLPKSSIEGFVTFLYFAPPVKLENPIEAFTQICHCIQLCNEVGMSYDSKSYLLWILERKIIPKIRPDRLIQQILILWVMAHTTGSKDTETYSMTSRLMSLLVSHGRRHSSELDIEKIFCEVFEVTNFPLPESQLSSLSAYLKDYLCPRSLMSISSPQTCPWLPVMTPQPLEWDKNLSASSRPENAFEYIVTIEEVVHGGVICNGLLLYTQWKYFERLCKADYSVEAKTRHVALPSGLKPSSLLAILSVPHGTYEHIVTLRKLSTREVANIYRFGRELQLTDSPAFADLWNDCCGILQSSVSEWNCTKMLHTWWKEGIEQNSELFQSTLLPVRTFISRRTLSQLPKELSSIIAADMTYHRPVPPSRRPDDMTSPVIFDY